MESEVSQLERVDRDAKNYVLTPIPQELASLGESYGVETALQLLDVFELPTHDFELKESDPIG